VNTGYKKNSGLSLVELMISITIGLLIMAGVVQLYAASNLNARAAQGVSRIQENIRYAMSRIGDDVSQAGNIKCATTSISTGYPLGSTGLWDDFENSYVSGVNNVEDPALPFATSDTLVVKYIDYSNPYALTPTASTTQFTLANTAGLNNGELVAAGNCFTMSVFPLSLAGTTVTAPRPHFLTGDAFAALYAGDTGAYTYFIASSAGGVVCSDANIHNCSLWRQKNDGFNNGGVIEELVQGVHGLQVRYGREDDAVALQYFSDAADAAGNFNRIDRVEVTLFFNSITANANEIIIRPVTRVFAIRNVWE
jgi:type IV pilus assembly protein PilW